MKLYLENVRSFAGKHALPIAPLTVLVGENSSGKSTCLAMLSAMFSERGFPSRPAFNEPPFDLGGYDTIATYKGGKYGRAKHFAVGYSATPLRRKERGPVDVSASYTSSLGQPTLATLSIKRGRSSLNLTLDGERVRGRLIFGESERAEEETAAFDIDEQFPEGRLLTLSSLTPAIFSLIRTKNERVLVPPLMDLLDHVPIFRTVAVAPVRTKPKRTYDPVSDEFRPEGDHIPLVLARALSATPAGRQREQLSDALKKFGDSSGLFTEVKVKNLGKSQSDPFQILVAVAGRAFNLSDVGYGVSQALPVVVESALTGYARLLLLQQPEVHLHPKAQAALGSFFAQLATEERRFVIETHSDYLVDRVRQEVAKGTIDSGLVSLIFFERSHGETRTYPLELDGQGNILDAPPSYRDFFLSEESALLKRAHRTS